MCWTIALHFKIAYYILKNFFPFLIYIVFDLVFPIFFPEMS